MSTQNEMREIEILKFIQENEPCTFGDIRNHLEKKNLDFKQKSKDKRKANMPLARKLNELINIKITKDVDAKPRPTYSIIQNYALDTSQMGDAFRHNYIETFFTGTVPIITDYMKDDIPLNPLDSDNEKFVKSMVMRYGFYMLSMLIKSYEQAFTRKHFDRNIWVESTMNLMKDETWISEGFLGLLDLPFVEPKWDMESDEIPRRDLTNKKNRRLLKNKLGELRDVMDKTYPQMHKSVVLYDAFVERHPKKIRIKDIPKVNIKK